jgi:Histidine kinase-, DNA gyrase B-, and HSP90-like ATPase
MSAQRQSLRGAGFGPVLATQRAYARESSGRAKLGLMVPEAFVRGIRDLGYRSNGDAVAELIDNALQAYADRIDVLFGYDGSTSIKKPLQLAVVDNGHGMEPDMIRMAVMWGGTHRENDRNGLGRYGYGLPCSSVSLGRRFTVFSQVGGGSLHAVSLDLDGITAGKYTNNHGEIVVPAPVPGLLPAFVAKHIATHYRAGWTSGTVILIDKLDRLEWSTTQGLRDNLCRKFGVTYHKLRGEAALFVDGDYVEPIDPLFLTPEFYLHEVDEDRAQAFDPVRIEVRDPDTAGYMGAIVIRYAWLPPSFGSIDKARDAVGLNANARFSILKDYNGVIFSRNGRLIDVQNRTPWTSFINNDRYIKVEIEFSATLDETFGVTTSKQQVTVSPLIWDLLRQAGLPKAIEQLRNKVKQAKVARRLKVLMPGNGERRLSERAMSIASAMGEGGSNNPQWDLALRVSPYRVEFETMPDKAFFRVGRHRGARVLYLNTTHRFYDELYDGPTSTPELRSSLEILLFCLGDVMLEGSEETQAKNQTQVMSWSRRLDLALGMLTAHLTTGDHEDVGPLPSPTKPT